MHNTDYQTLALIPNQLLENSTQRKLAPRFKEKEALLCKAVPESFKHNNQETACAHKRTIGELVIKI